MFSSSIKTVPNTTTAKCDEDPFNNPSSPSSLFSNLISDLSPLMGNFITPVTSAAMTPTAFLKEKDRYFVSRSKYKFHQDQVQDQVQNQVQDHLYPDLDCQSLVSDQLIINEQFLQAQEYLASSANYMNEIENFFQELSTQQQPKLPHNNNNNNKIICNSHGIELIDSFNFEEFGSVIDPAIFIFKPPTGDGECETEIDEDEDRFVNETPSSSPPSTNQISVMDF